MERDVGGEVRFDVPLVVLTTMERKRKTSFPQTAMYPALNAIWKYVTRPLLLSSDGVWDLQAHSYHMTVLCGV